MRPRLALSIGAVFYILLGIPGLLAPAQMMSAMGLPTPDVALHLTRDVGLLAIGVGLIDWLARDAVGAPLRGLLWANILIRIGAGVLTGLEIAAGAIPITTLGGPAIAITFGISIALIAMFALALRKADELPAGA
jgi:hypothetical protein